MLFSCYIFDTLIKCHFYKEAWTSSLYYYAAALDCHLRVTSKKLTLLAYMTVARTGIYTSAWAPLLAICVDWKLSRFSASDNRVFDAHLLYVCNMLKKLAYVNCKFTKNLSNSRQQWLYFLLWFSHYYLFNLFLSHKIIEYCKHIYHDIKEVNEKIQHIMYLAKIRRLSLRCSDRPPEKGFTFHYAVWGDLETLRPWTICCIASHRGDYLFLHLVCRSSWLAKQGWRWHIFWLLL